MHKYPLVGMGVSSGKCLGDEPQRTTELRGFPCVSRCSFESPGVKTLLPRGAGRNLEVHAVVVIGFACGGEIEVGEENLVGAARAELKQGIAHDGVIDHVGLMAVF